MMAWIRLWRLSQVSKAAVSLRQHLTLCRGRLPQNFNKAIVDVRLSPLVSQFKYGVKSWHVTLSSIHYKNTQFVKRHVAVAS